MKERHAARVFASGPDATRNYGPVRPLQNVRVRIMDLSPSRTGLHDSRPVWIANLSLCDSFIHCTSPV
jgi:hypothetical protein